MQSSFVNKKNKKRKLKPIVKIFIYILFILLFIFCIYKFNLTSKTSIFFKNSYLSVKNIFIKKNPINLETASTSEDKMISIFKDRLPSQNLAYASSTFITENNDIKIFLKDTKNDLGFIFVSSKDNPEEIWNTFASILLSDSFKNNLYKNISNLDYIDLRFKNKVFYKFNNLNTSSKTIFTIPTSTTDVVTDNINISTSSAFVSSSSVNTLNN